MGVLLAIGGLYLLGAFTALIMFYKEIRKKGIKVGRGLYLVCIEVALLSWVAVCEIARCGVEIIDEE